MPRTRPRSLGIALAALVACNDPERVEPSAPPPVDGPNQPAPIDPPKPVVTPPSPPVVDTARELHVVATRRGPIALSVGQDVELALAGVLPITLRTTEPIVHEARFREGLPTLTEAISEPIVDLVKFGGRWPHEATLVVHVASEYSEGSFTRVIRWNGGAWERDDPVVRGLKRYFTPIGPFELGTTLVLPSVEHTSPGKRGWIEALERAKPKQLVRRLVDGSTTQGPSLPPEEHWRFASTPEGWVFSGSRSISMWSPGATEWETTELPDGTDAAIAGFVVIAKDDVYAYGMRGFGVLDARGGYIAHYDGKTWEAMPAPKCSDGITRLAPGRPASWAYCVNENYEPRRPPITRELWRTDANGAWQRVTLAHDPATSRVRVDALAKSEEPPPLDEAHPRATDIAITADGTLWLSISAHQGGWNEEQATWSLARSSTAAQVLVLPSDDELFAPAPN